MPSDVATIHLDLLGPPEARVGPRLLTFSTHKTQALLFYPALEGRPLPREYWATLLWPNQILSAATPRSAIRSAICKLPYVMGTRRYCGPYRPFAPSDAIAHFEKEHQLIQEAAGQIGVWGPFYDLYIGQGRIYERASQLVLALSVYADLGRPIPKQP